MTIRFSVRALTFGLSVVIAGSLAVTAEAAMPAARGSAGSYALWRNTDGTVVRRNPCATVRYQINLRGAPARSWADTREAIRRLHVATGLTFVYAGQTTRIPQRGFGQRGTPPPLTIAWARPGTGSGASNLLSSSPGALGQGGWVETGGRNSARLRIVTGYVVINRARSATLRSGFGVGPTRGELLSHELGHTVGLNHTSDRSQVMYPYLGRYSGYGAGDLAGLRKVGRPAGCIR